MPKSTSKSKPAKKASSGSQKTLVTFLLDRSGSMSSGIENTISAFNEYVSGLKKAAGDLIDFTLVQFDQNGQSGVSFEKTCVNVPVKNAPALSKDNFIPRGVTPLIEAATKTINAVAESLTKRKDSPKVVVAIQTDGHENASSAETTWESLKTLIAEKQKLGWEFLFMGAGIDSYQQSARMGIATANTVSYDNTNLGTMRAAFSATAQNTALYASGMTETAAYSSLQKSAAGDVFDPDINKTKKKPSIVNQPGGGTGGTITTPTMFGPVGGSWRAPQKLDLSVPADNNSSCGTSDLVL